MRYSRIIIGVMFVGGISGLLFLVMKGNENERPKACLLSSEDIEWDKPDCVRDAVYSVSSNIVSQSLSQDQALERVLKLADDFLRLPYAGLSADEIRLSVAKYDELVVFICLGLLKYGADANVVGQVVIAARERLRRIEMYLRNEASALKKDNSQRYNIAAEIVRNEYETYVRYWENVGIRFIFGKFGDDVKKDFLEKWDESLRLKRE